MMMIDTKHMSYKCLYSVYFVLVFENIIVLTKLQYIRKCFCYPYMKL